MSWEQLKQWRPFSIDALGLVTLLGADEVDQALGTLSRRRFTEFLPFLAAFVIAQDRIDKEQAGYALYNITDGITTTELKGWFTRWLSAQHVLNQTTIFRWRIIDPPRNIGLVDLIAPLLAILVVAPLCVCTIWIEDWFGVANAAAILACILVRAFVLWERRRAIDLAVKPAPSKAAASDLPQYSEKRPFPTASSETVQQLHRQQSMPLPDDHKKILVTRADGKLITIYAPQSIQNIFTRDTKLPHPRAYRFIRHFGWLAFGVQMCVLGMCSLFAQIYIVALLVLSTWLMCTSRDFDTGTTRVRGISLDGTACNFARTNFGTTIEIEQEDPCLGETESKDRRMYAFMRLEADEKQESMLKHWSMLPFDGVPWYQNYFKAKAEYADKVAKVKAGIELSRQSSGLTLATVSSKEPILSEKALVPK